MTTELTTLLEKPVQGTNGLQFSYNTKLRPFEKAGEAALDFSVEKRDLFTSDGIRLKRHFAVGRVGSPDINYDVCGKVWEAIQPEEVKEVARLIATLTNGTIERSYALNAGQRFGAVIALPGHLVLGSKDVNVKCITIGCGNDGSALIGMSHMMRLFCSNQYYSLIDSNRKHAKKAQVVLRIRHTKNGAERVRMATKIAQQLSAAFLSSEEMAYKLSNRPIDAKNGELAAYYDKVLPYPAKPDSFKDEKEKETFEQTMERLRAIRGSMRDTFVRECEQLQTGPSLWLAMNSVTKWAQHDMRIKGKDDPENRAWSADQPDGNGFKMTIAAQIAALKMCQV